MPNSTDPRRVAVWLVGAMFSACACLFLACSCLGVRGWAATGRDTATPAADPRPELNAAPTSLDLDVGTQERRDIEQRIACAQHIAMVTMDDGKVNAMSSHAIGAQGALGRASQSRGRCPHILLRKARQQSMCTARASRYCSAVIPVPSQNSCGYRRNSSTP